MKGERGGEFKKNVIWTISLMNESVDEMSVMVRKLVKMQKLFNLIMTVALIDFGFLKKLAEIAVC